jgi:hypothetical protein
MFLNDQHTRHTALYLWHVSDDSLHEAGVHVFDHRPNQHHFFTGILEDYPDFEIPKL